MVLKLKYPTGGSLVLFSTVLSDDVDFFSSYFDSKTQALGEKNQIHFFSFRWNFAQNTNRSDDLELKFVRPVRTKIFCN